MPKEYAITFMPVMVEAIIAGRKTETRRVIKFPAKNTIIQTSVGESNEPLHSSFSTVQVGDIMWVREEHYRFGFWDWQGFTKTGIRKYRFVAINGEVKYADNPPEKFRKSIDKVNPYGYGWYKRLARFMPKSAARTRLEVTGIRAERLGDISEEDAISEGIQFVVADTIRGYKDYFPKPKSIIESIVDTPQESFATLWEAVHGSYDPKTWVWVRTFKRI